MNITLEGAQLYSNLAWLGKLVWEGKDIVLLKNGQPYLKLLPHPEGEPSDEVLPRPIGLMAGQIWISPDFDEEDLDIIEAFEGKYANDEVVFGGFYIKPESPEGADTQNSHGRTGTDS